MGLTAQDAKDLVGAIRTIAKQEFNTENIEYSYFGVVAASHSDITYDVAIPSAGSIYPNLYNKTGTTLTVGDAVIIHARDNNFGNAYIAVKNGYTAPGSGTGGTTSYTLPVATTYSLGGVKAGDDITISTDGIMSVNDNSHNHTVANVTGLQVQLDGKVNSTRVLTDVPANAVFTDTVYTHPATHPASIIVQDSSNRFVTDAEKATWNGKQDALGYTPLNSTLKGVANGLAELGSDGKVPTSQLPTSSGDSLEEYANLASFPTPGVSDKIYVATDTNLIYRWTGSAYTSIGQPTALGETSTTAYRGDRGKIAYDHSQLIHAIGEAGMVMLPSYLDNGDGTVTIGVATARIYSSNDFSGELKEYSITGGTYTLGDNATTYIVVNYNSGTPEYQAITNYSLITESNIIPVFALYRHGTTISRLNYGILGRGLSNKIHQRLIRAEKFSVESGLILSESATRRIIVSSGVVWHGITQINMQACDSNVANTCELISNVGGVTTFTAITQYNNTQYDNGTNLALLGNNHYGINWVYRSVENSSKTYVLLGNEDYETWALAALGLPRADVPDIIKSGCILVGRIIVRATASSAAEIDNIANPDPVYATIPNHDNLKEIMGGDSTGYYHLTYDEHSKLHTHTNKTSLDLVSGTNTGNETATTIGSLMNDATEKTTTINADMLAIMDSAASNIMKKISFSNLKSSLGGGSGDVNVVYVYMYSIDAYATAPVPVNDAWCYFNTTDNKVYKYNGTVWTNDSSDAKLSIFFNNTDNKIYNYDSDSLIFGDITSVITGNIITHQYSPDNAPLSSPAIKYYSVADSVATNVPFKNNNMYISIFDMQVGTVEKNIGMMYMWVGGEQNVLLPLSFDSEIIDGFSDKLSAFQLKAITGTVAPSTSTVGQIGQEYINTSTTPNTVYHCSAISGNVYTWTITHSTAVDSMINQNNAAQTIKFWSGTQAQYDAITTKDATTLYFVV